MHNFDVIINENNAEHIQNGHLFQIIHTEY